MELVRGKTAAELLAQGALPWEEATRLIADACRGLAAAHDAGLVHRDVKPSNIMRTVEGLVKVADFGLAKAIDAPQTSCHPLTQSGMVVGTPLYMSPEQCRGESVDARSDLYSLGATYFALLTGRPPFTDDQPMQVMFAHCSKPIPDPRTICPDLPSECAQMVMKAMAKDPAERFASAHEFLAELSDLLKNRSPKTQGNSAPHSPPEKVAATLMTAAPLLTIEDQTVAVRADAPTKLIQDANSKSPNGGSRNRSIMMAGGVLLLLALVALVWWPNLGRQKGEVSDPSLRETKRQRVLLQLVADFPELPSEVRCVALSSDGSTVFAGSRDGCVREWDVASRRLVREVISNQKDIHAIATSRRWLAAGGEDRIVWLVSLIKDQPPIRLVELPHVVQSLAISPDGERLAIGSSNSIELYELNNEGGQRIREVANSNHNVPLVAREVYCVAFSSDSRWLAATSWEKYVGLWDARQGKLREVRRPQAHELMSVAFVPETNRLVFGANYQDGLYVWDFTQVGTEVRSVPCTQNRSVRTVVALEHDVVLANGEWDGWIRMYDLTRNSELGSAHQKTSAGVTGMALSADRRVLAACGGDERLVRGYLQVWRLTSEGQQ